MGDTVTEWFGEDDSYIDYGVSIAKAGFTFGVAQTDLDADDDLKVLCWLRHGLRTLSPNQVKNAQDRLAFLQTKGAQSGTFISFTKAHCGRLMPAKFDTTALDLS